MKNQLLVVLVSGGISEFVSGGRGIAEFVSGGRGISEFVSGGSPGIAEFVTESST